MTARLILLALALGAGLMISYRVRRRDVLPRNRVRHMRIRLRLRLRPGRGHATLFELWLRWGRLASLRKSRRIRPSLTLPERVACPDAHSVRLGRGQLRHGLRLPLEEHAVIMAPPRTGKTGLLASVILHFPGPVLSTTTKADVFGLTSGVRQATGPAHVFNPQGIGGVPSTFRWSPIDGCQDPAVAIRRADGFANALKLEGDNAFFANSARSYLRTMFHAAALTRGDMALVAQWALTGINGGAVDAERILAGHGARTWADELAQIRGPSTRTNATTAMVMAQALGFMSDPALAAAVTGTGRTIDFGQLLAERGTLYMIADTDHDDSPLAPLFAAMASELHYQAALTGQASPGARLDPPLLMALDEIVQVCPVPLPKWAADSGGKGIQLMSVTHGQAQLAGRWGDHGMQTILDTAGVLLMLGGITDTATLDMASKLCGQAAWTERGQDHDSRHDVMTAAMVRQLPDGRGLLIRGGYSPVIARLPRAWKDRAYRQAARRGRAAARLAVITPRAAEASAQDIAARLAPAEIDGREAADVLPAGSNGHGTAGPRAWRSS